MASTGCRKDCCISFGIEIDQLSSVVFSAWLKMRKSIPAEETCVLLITGSGLKDVQSAARGLGLAQ